MYNMAIEVASARPVLVDEIWVNMGFSSLGEGIRFIWSLLLIPLPVLDLKWIVAVFIDVPVVLDKGVPD